MTKSIILLATILATSFSSSAQNESVVLAPVSNLQGVVHGCTPPIRITRPMNCSGPVKISEKVEQEDALDITDPELSGLMASPNPTKGYLSVSIPPNLIGFEIQVIDMTGRFVGNSVPITGERVDLNIEGESGVYLIYIQTDTEIITERILLDK